MHSDEDDNERPVSFQELKKRWADQESSTLSATPRRPSPGPQLTSSQRTTPAALSRNPSSTSLSLNDNLPPPDAPPLPTPTKPLTTAPSAAVPVPLAPAPAATNRVSTLASQFNQQVTVNSSNTPARDASTSSSDAPNASAQPMPRSATLGMAPVLPEKDRPITSPFVVENRPRGTSTSSDPFLDKHGQQSADDDISGDEDDDSESTTSVDSDTTEEIDAQNERTTMRVQETQISYGNASKISPPPGKPKQRPPPPPPTKKYHRTAPTRPPTMANPPLIKRTASSGPPSTTQLPARPSKPSVPITQPIPIASPAANNIIAPTPPTAEPVSMLPSAAPILPPRPSSHVPIESPQLPPRPSTSTLARSHTVSAHYLIHSTGPNVDGLRQKSGNSPVSSLQSSATPLKRSQTMVASPNMPGSSVAREGSLMPKSIYPDFSSATRNPPLLATGELNFSGGQHSSKGSQPMAAYGSCIATGVTQARVWNALTGKVIYAADLVGPNDHDRIRSFAFLPTPRLEDQGRFLWAGMQDGSIIAMDTKTDTVHKITSCHKHPITFMMRRRNMDIWTLDESGLLAIWPVACQSSFKPDKLMRLDVQPQKSMVMSKAVAAVIADAKDLWMSNGRSLHVYRGFNKPRAADNHDQQQIRISNDLGNITDLTTIPCHPQFIVASHDDGKVTLWDKRTLEKAQVYTISLYGICKMVTVDDSFLWTGYNTGMIYVYDTRPTKWEVIKMWRAHQGPLTCLLVDESRFLHGDGTLQVVSGDSHGSVSIWDGLMTDNWHDRQLHTLAKSYCNYRPIQVMICSWNIDANKPEKLVGKDNELVHEWLGTAQNPDIIVVGIQEIVDLESKKQTAKSLFASRKKIETLEDADEMLTHRYRLWHDHLVRVIGDNYGRDAYTVFKTDQLVGLFSCVFIKKSEIGRAWNCDATVVKTGLKVMNKSIHGNKGGIAIRFMFEHSSLCFVNCHLAAGQSHTQDRNADAEGILQSATFPEYQRNMDLFANGGDGSMILDHEHCFLSGDLNYRIAMDRQEVLDVLRRKDKKQAWETLQLQDQLKRQHITNPLFKLLWFNEAPLMFDPTYKYDRNTNNYDSSEKKRVPAWCDRILWRSNLTQNLDYRRHEVKASDHRPISATFQVQVKEIDGDRRDRLLEQIEQDWFHLIDRAVANKKVAYLLDYELCTQDQARQILQDNQWDVDAAVSCLL